MAKTKKLTEGHDLSQLVMGPILVRRKSLRRSLQKQFAYLPKDLKSKPICMGLILKRIIHIFCFIENQSPIQARSQALKNYLASYVGQCYTITTRSTRASNTLDLASDVEEKLVLYC